MENIYKTTDGSFTLYSEKYKQFYHNISGAITESLHIYINLGLKSFYQKKINILEIGYGTGLNALLTFKHNFDLQNNIFYHGIDNNIIPKDLFSSLNIVNFFDFNNKIIEDFYFKGSEDIFIDSNFQLRKQLIDFNDFIPQTSYDLIYFDAFSPQVQPDMWSEKNLTKLINVLQHNGVFVTYCVQGKIKELLRSLGMEVKRFNGPPGKRHVLRATKF